MKYDSWKHCHLCKGAGRTLLLYSWRDCDECEASGLRWLGWDRLYYAYLRTPEGKQRLEELLREEQEAA